MLLHQLVDASHQVAATRSRKAKVSALATALAAAPPDQVETATAYLSGVLRQRRTGLGWRSLTTLPSPADSPRLTVGEVHEAFERIAAFSGAGSQADRAAEVTALFAAATADEQAYLRGLVTGELRQGALDGLMLEAIAVAADVPATLVRRAAMMCGATLPVAAAALSGGAEALAAFRLEVGRPVRPMLASSAPDLTTAFAKATGPLVVDTKLDGIRIQVHKVGDEVGIYTRTLESVTERLPSVVALVRSLPAQRLVLDGEALMVDSAGRARPFQETASRSATRTEGSAADLTPYFFDLLHVDGDDLLDTPGGERWDRLRALVPDSAVVPRLVTADAEAAHVFFTEAVAAGHEGVVVKDPTAPYDAGRRGAGWVKVKPRHTLDLVVLAVEWGSGRRKGLLSNIHLGARDPESGGFVMLGKTFKGMTDEILAWQTERFLELETSRDGHVVHVRPEQVVEIAFDGVQRSTRYPGGVALRFARVLRYRDDKPPTEADLLTTVQSFL